MIFRHLSQSNGIADARFVNSPMAREKPFTRLTRLWRQGDTLERSRPRVHPSACRRCAEPRPQKGHGLFRESRRQVRMIGRRKRKPLLIYRRPVFWDGGVAILTLNSWDRADGNGGGDRTRRRLAVRPTEWPAEIFDRRGFSTSRIVKVLARSREPLVDPSHQSARDTSPMSLQCGAMRHKKDSVALAGLRHIQIRTSRCGAEQSFRELRRPRGASVISRVRDFHTAQHQRSHAKNTTSRHAGALARERRGQDPDSTVRE